MSQKLPLLVKRRKHFYADINDELGKNVIRTRNTIFTQLFLGKLSDANQEIMIAEQSWSCQCEASF